MHNIRIKRHNNGRCNSSHVEGKCIDLSLPKSLSSSPKRSVVKCSNFHSTVLVHDDVHALMVGQPSTTVRSMPPTSLQTQDEFFKDDSHFGQAKILTPRWICEHANPKPCYPLEYHAELIQDTPYNIAKRIDRCLKARSVQVDFHSMNHAKVTCITDSFLKYIITLYSPNHFGDDTNTDTNANDGNMNMSNCTIVEVQRRKGCSLEFVKERQAILQAAKGQGQVNVIEDKNITLSIPTNIASSYPPPGRQYLKDILLRYVSDFHNPNYHTDALYISLNHIASMTDCHQSGNETALLVATMVIGDVDIGIRDILALVIDRTSSLTQEDGDEMSIMMRHVALRILVNCLSLLLEERVDEKQVKEQDKEIDTDMEQVEPWLETTLFPLVIENIRRCNWWHNASLSCECLKLLLRGSEAIREECQGDEKVQTALETAVSVGQENHARLYQEARGAIHVLGK